MKNFSLKGEDIHLINGANYYIVDALFLNEIKHGLDKLNQHNLDQEIETKIFPYTDASFAKIRALKNKFHIRDIFKIHYEDIDLTNKSCFICDTGLILFIEESIFRTFVGSYEFDGLVNSLTEVINFKYWNEITCDFRENSIGLVLAPGIGSGYEFDGSGVYQIKLTEK